MRAIRRFIEEEEQARGKASVGQRPPATSDVKSGATYQLVEQPSAVVREEEFAKQLRIARYLAGASVASSRALELTPQAKTPEEGRSVAKAKPKSNRATANKKAREEELAKERRRAGRVARQKVPPSSQHRSERERVRWGDRRGWVRLWPVTLNHWVVGSIPTRCIAYIKALRRLSGSCCESKRALSH